MFFILLRKEKNKYARPKWTLFRLNFFEKQDYAIITSQRALISQTDCFEVIQKQLPAFLHLHQALFTQNNFYRWISEEQSCFHCPNSNRKKITGNLLQKSLAHTWGEPNLVWWHQFWFENQSQVRKVRWQYHQILMACAWGKLLVDCDTHVYWLPL